MNLFHAAMIANVATILPGVLLADTLNCTFRQDCELGAACVNLPEPQQAWLVLADDGSAGFEMAGQVTPVAEVYRSENATGYAASPSPNNSILLTVHSNGTLDLSIQYAGASGLFGNTMRGACQAETE